MAVVRRTLLAVAVALPTTLAAPIAQPPVGASPQTDGVWGPVLDWGVQAKHMIVLPTGNVLVWSTGLDARVWDSSTDASFTPTPFPGGDLHCAGQATLADGRIVVIGGQENNTHEGIAVTALFDAHTNTWTSGADMNWGRWYATATTLPDGRLLATSGDDINTDRVTIPEIYDPVTDTWSRLPGADRRQMLYPSMFVAPGGKIFEAGPRQQTYFLDITNGGSWTQGPTNSFGSSGYAESAVQYAPGKILRAGGGDPAFASAAVIDLNVANPQWRDIAPMHHARRRHDLTLMADGRVLAIGGTGRADSEQDAVLIPEIWDPDTEQWTEVAPMAEARMYHSSTVLLPDGRIVVAGGEAAGRKRAQIYLPPYLNAGPRPTISSSPAAAGWGTTFNIGTPDAAGIAKVALLRASGGTHTFDHNQRYVPLSFTAGAGQLNVQSPPDGWTAPPGDYMVVIENAAGVPSVAKWIRIGSAAALVPGTVTGTVTNATTGQPVPGATVAYAGDSATTDANGDYVLDSVPPGEQSLTASATGFADQTRSASVGAGGTTVQDFALVAPGTVSGVVTSSVSGLPINGAVVEIAGRSATTDATGRYTITVESGPRTATVNALTYLSRNVPVDVVANSTVTLDVALDEAPTILEGEVLDLDTGEPIEGATVSFSGGTTTTDQNGFYKFVDVVPDTYDVTASAPGYLPETEPVLVDKGLPATLDFNLAPIPPPITTEIAVADGRVKSTSPTTSYGFDGYLRTRHDSSGGTIYRSFLRFDLTSMTTPIESATLRLFVNDGSNDGGDVFAVDWSGTEANLDWNRAPALTGAPVASLGAVAAGGWVEVDVTAAVVPGGPVSFGLSSSSSNSAYYSSREGANPPELVIETADVVVPDIPDITSMAPTSGAPGDQVVLTGVNLASVTDVSFNGTPAAIIGQDATEITTEVPVGASSGPIEVTSPEGSATSGAFTVLLPPEVVDFSPSSGGPGTVVAIDGSGLATTQSVTFGGTAATFTVVSDTRVNATVPAGTGGGPIAVTTAVGNTTSSTSFVVTDPPPISSFAPALGPVGTTVTFSGSAFSTVSAVTFAGTPASFSIVSDSQLTAVVPTGANTGPIAVTNATGTTTTADFTVIHPPTISGFDPASGTAGATNVDVTITGTGFTTATAVAFNGTPATGLSIDSDTQIRVEVPFRATSGPISVTNPAGTVDTGANHFTVLTPPPTVTVSVTDDATVKSTSPTNNYGTADYLRLRSGSPEWSSFLRFDVAGLPNPPTRATLRLWVTDGSNDGMDVFAVDPGWSEGAITFATAPSTSGAPIVTSPTLDTNTWIEVDVTAAVTGNGPVAFGLRPRSSNSAYFDSREGTFPPQLVIETAPVSGPYISSFTPASGPPGTRVDIYGSNMTTVTEVHFGDAVLGSHHLVGGGIINGGHLRVTVPADATTGPIKLVSPAGTFTTSTNFVVIPPDLTPPTVTDRSPAPDAVDVAVGANVTATFSEPVSGVSGATFTLAPTAGGGNVAAGVTYDPATRRATLDPVGALASNTQYTATLTGGITDQAATPNPLASAPVTWTFTTADVPPPPSGEIALNGGAIGATITTGDSVTLPAWAPAPGDLILVSIARRDETIVTGISGNGLTWTRLASVPNVQGQGGISVWWAQSSSPTPGEITVTVAGNTRPVAVSAQRYSGVDTSTPIEAFATNAGPASDDNDMLQSVTTITPGAWVIGAGWHRTKDFTVPSGEHAIDINRIAGSGGDTTRVSVWREGPIPTPGPVQIGAQDDLSGAHDWAMLAIALRPSP